MYPDTFSQYDEQQAILGYFQDGAGSKWKRRVGDIDVTVAVEDRRFLDIGAWSPKVFSNTRALFEAGWSGVVIDPSPDAVKGLAKEYGQPTSRVQVVGAAVALDGAPIQIKLTDDSVSSADLETQLKWAEEGGYYGVATFIPITWPQINNWWGGFNFVNIDAEGLSVDLFRAMLDSGAEPECCCVEHDGRLVELAELATARGYRLLYSNGTNAVWGK